VTRLIREIHKNINRGITGFTLRKTLVSIRKREKGMDGDNLFWKFIRIHAMEKEKVYADPGVGISALIKLFSRQKTREQFTRHLSAIFRILR